LYIKMLLLSGLLFLLNAGVLAQLYKERERLG
jgi:hypothetical protein